jgi:hypothetical protein
VHQVEKKDLARTGKGLACNSMAGRHGLLPAEPGTGKRPELTTAPLRLAPLKLLPFGGTAHCCANESITTQDENHDNPRQIRVTRMCADMGHYEWGITSITTLLMDSIAMFHFTWPALAPIICPRVVAGRAAGPQQS